MDQASIPFRPARDASIDLDWPDQMRRYQLKIGQLRELQERCDAGPMVILRRLVEGTWLVDDVLEPIRLGLIGGGAKLDEALKLKTFVEQRPLGEAVKWAQAIVAAAVVGVPDEVFDQVQPDDSGGKSEAGTGGSPSSTSTATEPSSAGPPARSMN